MSCFHIILRVSVFNLQSLKKSWFVLNYTKKPDRKKQLYVGLTFNTITRTSQTQTNGNLVRYDYEQRMKFLTWIEQEAKELEINGFLHNSRGTNKIDSTSSNTQQE